MHHQNYKLASGFTLLEVIIVVGILSLLSVAGFLSLRQSVERINLDTTSHDILTTLQLARTRTLSSQDQTVYGVHFETTQYVLFKGSSYSPSSTDNEPRTLPTGVEIHNVNLAGASNEVIFERLTGSTSQTGTISLRQTNYPSNFRTINVLASGEVGFQGTVNPIDSRLTDSRHLHFDLGWSIQNAAVLTLTFPTLTHTVQMADYFNSDKTEFDWEETVTVNSNEEVFRIHTHTLTASNTLLSIHRDRRYDNLAVTVAIDSKPIVSYTAGGVATVGAFGGTMEEQ